MYLTVSSKEESPLPSCQSLFYHLLAGCLSLVTFLSFLPFHQEGVVQISAQLAC